MPAGSQSSHILSRPETTLLLYRSYHHGHQLKVKGTVYGGLGVLLGKKGCSQLFQPLQADDPLRDLLLDHVHLPILQGQQVYDMGIQRVQRVQHV